MNMNFANLESFEIIYNSFNYQKVQFCHYYTLNFMLTEAAQNYETEKLSDSNLSFSLILNPIEVFFMATEISQSLIQLI